MLHRDFFDKAYKGSVGMVRPMTPSYWIDGEPTYTNVLRVRVSCGGGMGGSQWFEYICGMSSEDFIKAERFIKTKDIDGKDLMLNVNNIVDVRPYKIASARMYSNNTNFKTGEYLVRYLLDMEATAELR